MLRLQRFALIKHTSRRWHWFPGPALTHSISFCKLYNICTSNLLCLRLCRVHWLGINSNKCDENPSTLSKNPIFHCWMWFCGLQSILKPKNIPLLALEMSMCWVYKILATSALCSKWWNALESWKSNGDKGKPYQEEFTRCEGLDVLCLAAASYFLLEEKKKELCSRLRTKRNKCACCGGGCLLYVICLICMRTVSQ